MQTHLAVKSFVHEFVLYAALNHAEDRPVRVLQRLRAIAFDQEQARMLDVEAGDPGLFIERAAIWRTAAQWR